MQIDGQRSVHGILTTTPMGHAIDNSHEAS